MEKSLEVFGTKEVSIKEFMGASDKGLMLLSDYDLAKENLVALNLKHSIRVSELSEKKVFDRSELNELVSIRAELREPRYLIQKIEKNNISVFESYKKKDKANLKELIELNVGLEDSVDEMIKSEEKRKEQAKEEERVAEQKRIEVIEKKISDFESDSYKIIQETNIGNVEEHKIMLYAFVNDEFDYEEYEIMFEQAHIRVQSYWDNKCSEVQDKEQQRLENERLKELNLEVERKAKELQDRLDLEQRERKLKELQQKDEQFDIRKNRLDEIGFEYDEWEGFVCDEFDLKIDSDSIYDADISNFEKLLSNAKKLVADAKEQKEIADKENLYQERAKILLQLGLTYDSTKEYPIFLEGDSRLFVNRDILVGRGKEWFDEFVSDAKNAILLKEKEAQELELLLKEKAEKQKAIDLELSKKDAERLKKENAQRVKRLANDKKVVSESLEVYFSKVYLETENKEILEFIDEANFQLQHLKSVLLIQLKDL